MGVGVGVGGDDGRDARPSLSRFFHFRAVRVNFFCQITGWHTPVCRWPLTFMGANLTVL